MLEQTEITVIDVDKIGSATSPLGLAKTVAVVSSSPSPRAGDVVVVRALTDSATYNMLELPTGRLAKINPGDLLIGVLGRRRAQRFCWRRTGDGFHRGSTSSPEHGWRDWLLHRSPLKSWRRHQAGSNRLRCK
jgi:hypothetical protein